MHPNHTYRKGFSLITAIIVIILMASVSIFVMNLSSKMTRETTAQYQREQAMLYAKSYTEYAILAVMANDRSASGQCLNEIDGTMGAYTIQVMIAYIGSNAEIGNCAVQLDSTVATPGSPLSIIVDTYVSYKEPDYPNPANAPDIVYHKRTLQKI